MYIIGRDGNDEIPIPQRCRSRYGQVYCGQSGCRLEGLKKLLCKMEMELARARDGNAAIPARNSFFISSVDGCRAHRAPIRRGMHCNQPRIGRIPLALIAVSHVRAVPSALSRLSHPGAFGFLPITSIPIF